MALDAAIVFAVAVHAWMLARGNDRLMHRNRRNAAWRRGAWNR